MSTLVRIKVSASRRFAAPTSQLFVKRPRLNQVVTSVVQGRWTVQKAVDEGNSQVRFDFSYLCFFSLVSVFGCLSRFLPLFSRLKDGLPLVV